MSAEGKNVACVLHFTEVDILALLKGPGCHLVFLVLTDAVAHLPCAEIYVFFTVTLLVNS